MKHPSFSTRHHLAGVLALSLALPLGLGAAPKIGVLLKARTPFWLASERGALAAGEQLGAEVIVKAPASENDIAIQIQLLNILVGQGVDAIVLAANSREALVEPVAAAAARGIKIVVIDTQLAGEAKYVFVGTDQREAGRVAGALLGGLIADGDAVCFLKYNQTSGATEQRERGAFEKLRELHPGLVVRGSIYVGTEKGMEAERSAQLLAQYPDAKAIMASSTPATLAMIKVLQEKGRSGAIKFVGFGFNLNPEVAAAIDAGTLDGWVAQLPADVSFRGVKAALGLVKGDVVPKTIASEILVITRKNLHEPKVQALMEN